MQCPVCDYPNTVPQYRMRDRFFESTVEEFVLHYCSSCGLLFLDEKQVGDLGRFYPSGYWWQANGRGSGLERAYREWVVRRDQLKFVCSFFPRPQQEALLDIGCGAGTFVKQALRAGFDAQGLEQAEEAVAIAQDEAPGRIFGGEVQQLFERGERFDILTLFHALEHMPNPFRLLRTLRRLLRPPGHLFVQVPNRWSLQAKLLGPRWYGLDCPRHLYNFSEFSVLHLLGKAGFRIRRVRHFSLRDNAASLVSSLFPGLDPMSQKVKQLRRGGDKARPAPLVRNSLYFALLLMAQPLAYTEAKLGRGATITVYASLE